MSDTRPQSSTSIVERLRFDAVRCELHFSKGIADNIEEGIAEIERLTRENDALYDMLQGMRINLTKILEGRKALEDSK